MPRRNPGFARLDRLEHHLRDLEHQHAAQQKPPLLDFLEWLRDELSASETCPPGFTEQLWQHRATLCSLPPYCGSMEAYRQALIARDDTRDLLCCITEWQAAKGPEA